MKKLGLEPKELASRTRIPVTTLYGILSGSQARVTHESLYALAKALQTSMEWLAIGGDEASKPDELQYLLTPEEHELLKGFRAAKPRDRGKILGYVNAYGDEQGRPTIRAKDRRVIRR